MDEIIKQIRKSSSLIYYLFLLTLYLFKLRNIFLPTYFQQDDLAELRVASYTNFLCVIDRGDNHPFFSYFIWILNKIFGFDTPYLVSFFNVFVSFASVILIFKIFSNYLNNSSGLFAGTLFISSNSFLTYSVSLKQYPVEIFSITLLLYLISTKELTFNFLIKNKKHATFLAFLSGFSIIIPIFLLISVLFQFVKKNKAKLNIRNNLILISPLLIFGNQIIEKVTRESYESYWGNFFISVDSTNNFFSSFKFLTSLAFKNIFSSFYYEAFYYIFIIILLLPLLIKKPNFVVFSYVIVLSFIGLNIFRLYPLGGGRTDIVLIPFITSIFCFSVLSIIKNQKIHTLITFLVLIFAIFNVSAFYKVENLRTPIMEIESDFKDSNTLNIIMYDQRHSFDYEAKKIFGIKKQKIDNCELLLPNINNYFITEKLSKREKNISEINKIILQQNIQKINLIGIELEGTKGEFREFEKNLLLANFKIKDTKLFENGVYLVKLKKDK